MQRVISVIGFYTPQNEITLAGTRKDLMSLAELIACEGASRFIQFYVPEESPEPYDGFLDRLQLIEAAGPVLIHRNKNVLVVSGALEGRRALAYEVLQFLERPEYALSFVEKHACFKYYPGHSFLHSAALTLVISVVSLAWESLW